MPNFLFRGVSIFDVIANQVEVLKSAVRKLSEQDLRDEERLIEQLVKQFEITVPTLDETRVEATEREIQLDVSRDPNRLIFDRSRPFYIPATEVTIHVPFTGEAPLFDVQPTTFNLNPPMGEVVNQELQVKFTMFQGSPDVKPQYTQAIQQIKQHLDWLRPSADQLKGSLRQAATSEIQQRKQQLSSRKGALESLGIPMRKHNGTETHSEPVFEDALPPPKSRSRKHSPAEGWDVFISHASEDRDAIAKALSERLRNDGFSVWYDEFSLRLGDSLRESIDRGLAKSRYGVVILSKAFFEKHWPAKELNGLATREVDGKKIILPVWHGVRFEEVREYSPMLADRVAVSTGLGLDKVVGEIVKVLRE